MSRGTLLGSSVLALALVMGAGCSKGPGERAAERGGADQPQPASSAAVETPRAADAPSASPQSPASSDSKTQTGGDTRPSAVDPAQGSKTGANVGEGSSYSRSTEKGQSTLGNSTK